MTNPRPAQLAGGSRLREADLPDARGT